MQHESAAIPPQQAPSAGHAHTHNLPLQPTQLLGREQEVAAVCALLRRPEVRLVTLTGPGGIGKTRLGLEAATDLLDVFAYRVSFVSFASIRDPDLVIPALAQMLGLKETGERPLLERLKELLRDTRMLLVLDNFEQVVVAAPGLSELLTACLHLKFLVTSRAALRVRDEHEFPVLPLALPNLTHLPTSEVLSQYAAVALFLERARSVKPDFQMTATNARTIAEICVYLDGLPLAIELAAARMKLLSPQALRARLDQRLAVLTSGARDVPVRQQTLRNTITWSYSLLGAAEQQLFRRLSVFVGGWTLESAEALYAALDNGRNDGAGALLDRMTSLLDNSLLYRMDSEGNEPRFAMLETIREYALEALAESQELDVAREAHAAYYLRLVEADLEREERWQGEKLEQLEQEHDNLRAALRSTLVQAEAGHDSVMALRLGGALTPFWLMRGHWGEGRAFLERALAKHEGVGVHILAKALMAAGKLAFQQGDYDRAEVLAKESQELFRAMGDTHGIAITLEIQGTVAWNRGKLATARALLEEVLTLYTEMNDKDGRANSLNRLAWLIRSQRDYTRARGLLEESLTLYKALGHTGGIADSLLLLSQLLFDTQTEPTAVHIQLEEALALFRKVSDKEGIAACYHLLGEVNLQLGDAVMASSWLEQSLLLHQELGHQAGIAWVLSVVARVAAAQDDHAAARSFYEKSLAQAKAIGDQELIVACLEGLAAVASVQGELMWAARQWGMSEVLREAMGQPRSPVERASYKRAVMDARRRLGERAFAQALAEGRAMVQEQALNVWPPPMEPTSSIVPRVTVLAPLTYPDGLTTREVEVLRLVAQGMTDAQVAEHLVISPRTVNTHLTSIYGKIGVSSRSEATHYALEQRLI